MQSSNPPPPRPRPIRVVVARMTHGHVYRVWGVPHPDVDVVGVYEPNGDVAARVAARFQIDRRLVHGDLARLLEATKPDAVVAYGSTREHLSVVEATAPRRIHVMVEKPLAVSVDHALRIRRLAKQYGIHVLTNYETTWYPTMSAVEHLVRGDSVIGPLRKLVIHDGHPGPKAIGVQPEFFEWLTDPAQNGAGALFDFGCYGANIATWLLKGETPQTVTAVTQQLNPEVYPRVDDDATVVVTYLHAEAIIQASWNWPVSRKDLEVYGTKGYILVPDANALRIRRSEKTPEESSTAAPRAEPRQNEWQYLAAVVRGTLKVPEMDPSSLENNVTVVRILEAARESARTQRTITLASPREPSPKKGTSH